LLDLDLSRMPDPPNPLEKGEPEARGESEKKYLNSFALSQSPPFQGGFRGIGPTATTQKSQIQHAKTDRPHLPI
jgi:hypothetical protein